MNTFASINRIPPEVLALIAHHRNADKSLRTLTHVCRRWREIFVSHASLWTGLDCETINKTRLFLERSKTSPLRIRTKGRFLNDAFLLTVPHLDRLESLSFSWSSTSLLQFIEHLGSPSPLLKTLSLIVTHGERPVLRDSIFGGTLSSLRELRLGGVITNLAWGNMTNLRLFGLSDVPAEKRSTTRLLDFFERAPLLREILLENMVPDSSDAPPGRIVPLPNLAELAIDSEQPHTTLMNHLLIPTGASINQTVHLSDASSLILSHLPNDFKNLKHLSIITSVTLSFASPVHFRFEGPSGGHRIFGKWAPWSSPHSSFGRQVLESLDVLSVSAVERLTIEHWQFTPSPTAVAISTSPICPIYPFFHLMDNLRALTLTACLNHPFLFALNPKKNAPRIVICPKLKELVVHIGEKERYFTNRLLAMAKERASRGARLAVVAIIDVNKLLTATRVLELRTYVTRVDYRRENIMPNSNATPRVVDLTSDESDWWP